MYHQVLDEKLITDERREAARFLRGASCGTHSLEDVKTALQKLLRDGNLFGITRDTGQIWYRARLCGDSDGFSNARDLIYPPNGAAGFGRASLPFLPVLYAAWNLPTALEECRPKVGQIYQVAYIRVFDGHQFYCSQIGERQSLFMSGGSTINSRITEDGFRSALSSQRQEARALRRDVFIDSFLAEEFRRSESGSEHYIVSAAYADFAFRFGGLMYPSVQSNRAINLAVSKSHYDSFFEMIGSEIFEITDHLGYGMFALRPHARSFDISSSGEIDWKSRRLPKSNMGAHGGWVVDPKFSGWRVSPAGMDRVGIPPSMGSPIQRFVAERTGEWLPNEQLTGIG